MGEGKVYFEFYDGPDKEIPYVDGEFSYEVIICAAGGLMEDLPHRLKLKGNGKRTVRVRYKKILSGEEVLDILKDSEGGLASIVVRQMVDDAC